MIVPRDPRPQFSQLAIVALNMDAGRSPMAGARQVGPDRFIMEDSRRPAPSWDSGPSMSVEVPESKPRTMARALWPNLA